MGTMERVSKAENSSDLKHKSEVVCDVDVLGAVGLASHGRSGHLAVFRVKFLKDSESWDEAVRQFVSWVRRSMERRRDTRKNVYEIAVIAIKVWCNDTCPACSGRKFEKITGQPALSDKICPACKGTGKISGEVNDEIVKDAIGRADSAVIGLQRNIEFKLDGEK